MSRMRKLLPSESWCSHIDHCHIIGPHMPLTYRRLFLTRFCCVLIALKSSVSMAYAGEIISGSRREAQLASFSKDGRHTFVLHYGSGITGAQVEAESLRRRGIRAIAMAGGKPDQVEVFYKFRSAGPYTNTQLNNGTVGAILEAAHEKINQ